MRQGCEHRRAQAARDALIAELVERGVRVPDVAEVLGLSRHGIYAAITHARDAD
jgi:hypothetical protein